MRNIDPIVLAEIMGEDKVEQTAVNFGAKPQGVAFTGNPFEDVLNKAIESLEGVSQAEVYANQLIEGYLNGKVNLQEVMLATSKMSILVQLAVTTVNSVVGSFKELTQMQV